MRPNSHTPNRVPAMPPPSITPAMVKSMARFLHRASAPDMEEAVTWDKVVATATVEGMPVKTSSGVIRKPPPTPNMPDKKPTPVPSAMSSSQLTDSSATGRYNSIAPEHARGRAGGQRKKPYGIRRIQSPGSTQIGGLGRHIGAAVQGPGMEGRRRLVGRGLV